MLLVVGGFALWRYTPIGELLDEEVLRTRLEALRHSTWAWPAMAGLLALFGLLCAPISPIIIANGAVFGVVGGAAANLVGGFVGAIICFYLARLLGHDLFAHLLRRMGLERVEAVLERHGFWTLVRIRFLPIPFGIVNYAAGLTPMKARRYLAASALPLVPVLCIYAYVGSALMTVAEEDRTGPLWGAGIVLVLLFLLSWIPGRRLRREVTGEPVADEEKR